MPKPAPHNQVIADIILEMKRVPQIVSEQKYNDWYIRILDEMEKQSHSSGVSREEWPTDEEIEDTWASHAHSLGSFGSWKAAVKWLKSRQKTQTK